MRAVVLRELGPAENLLLETVPDPQPSAGEVVVRLHAAALNHRDLWIRKGLYAGIKLPIILGSDGAGVVVANGVGVDPSLAGKEVIINPGFDWGEDERVQSAYFRILGLPDDGTYAEFVKAPATHIQRKPAELTWEEAAALPLAGLTAYRAVVTRAHVKAGEHVLITGIGGGVSLAALQIAKALGARVVVTSGSDAKIERAKLLGAVGGANYKSSEWSKSVVALTQGGPDVVIDSVGGDTLAKAIEIVKPGGRLVTYGATTGPVPQLEVRRIFWKQLSLLGSTMGTPREFAAMLELYSSAAIRPVVDRVFALADAPAAHMRMEEAGQFGKIVLKISV
jgi:NADPH:quinone reductase-like Zn-dependent oxidoreductase